MISHDTQLCLTEPEGVSEVEREQQDKQRRRKAGITKTDKGGQGAKTDTKLFLREAPVHLSKMFAYKEQSSSTMRTEHTVC